MGTDFTFSEAVCDKLGNYVYRLIDPRNGETFYVGRGRGNRVFDHVREATKLRGKQIDDDPDSRHDDASLKIDRINSIKDAGLEIVHVIHRHEIPDHSLAEVEAVLIDAYPGLTNKQSGEGSGAKGPMHVHQIIDKYELEEFEKNPPEKLILININQLKDRSNKEEILAQTRFAWRISKERAEQADYVLAVVRGVVVGAFKATEWLEASHENFKDHYTLENQELGRKGFNGEPVSDEIWKKFVGDRGKRIVTEEMKHIQNPIRYWNV